MVYPIKTFYYLFLMEALMKLVGNFFEAVFMVLFILIFKVFSLFFPIHFFPKKYTKREASNECG